MVSIPQLRPLLPLLAGFYREISGSLKDTQEVSQQLPSSFLYREEA